MSNNLVHAMPWLCLSALSKCILPRMYIIIHFGLLDLVQVFKLDPFIEPEKTGYTNKIVYPTIWVSKLTQKSFIRYKQGILKGGSITVLLTSCLTGLDSAV